MPSKAQSARHLYSCRNRVYVGGTHRVNAQKCTRGCSPRIGITKTIPARGMRVRGDPDQGYQGVTSSSMLLHEEFLLEDEIWTNISLVKVDFTTLSF